MATSEVSRILDQLQRAYQGPAWHGPALGEILSDVPAEMAARRPLPHVHTIWELALHITVWMSVAARRLRGEEITVLRPEQDWPPVPEPGEAGWKQALEALAKAQRNLEAEVSSLADERLADRVQGDRPYSIYTLLHGVVQHNLYHAGQIAMLKKAAR